MIGSELAYAENCFGYKLVKKLENVLQDPRSRLKSIMCQVKHERPWVCACLCVSRILFMSGMSGHPWKADTGISRAVIRDKYKEQLCVRMSHCTLHEHRGLLWSRLLLIVVDQECATGRWSRWDWDGLISGFRVRIKYSSSQHWWTQIRADEKQSLMWERQLCVQQTFTNALLFLCSYYRVMIFWVHVVCLCTPATHNHLPRLLQTGLWCSSGISPVMLSLWCGSHVTRSRMWGCSEWQLRHTLLIIFFKSFCPPKVEYCFICLWVCSRAHLNNLAVTLSTRFLWTYRGFVFV